MAPRGLYLNGQLESKRSYKDGEKVEFSERYHFNGQVKTRHQYKKGNSMVS